MNKDFTAKAEIVIYAPINQIWESFHDSEVIKKFMFGSEVITDWKKGSTIIWRGKWQGRDFVDKGEILEHKKRDLIKFTYYSSFSGKEDLPENYNIIKIKFTNYSNRVKVSIVQENNISHEAKVHAEENWNNSLKILKDLLNDDFAGG